MKLSWITVAPIVMLSVVSMAGCSSCDTQPDAAAGSQAESAAPVSINIISQRQYCGTAQTVPLLSYYDHPPTSKNLLFHTFPDQSSYQDQMILVEGGQRPTGGYGFSIAQTATIDNDTLYLTGQWSQPSAGAIVTQAVTSPCVLLAAPAGQYQHIVLLDAQRKPVVTHTKGDMPAARLKTTFE